MNKELNEFLKMLLKEPRPVPAVTLLPAMVGPLEVPQQNPRAVTDAPPSSVTDPDAVPVPAERFSTATVVTVAAADGGPIPIAALVDVGRRGVGRRAAGSAGARACARRAEGRAAPARHGETRPHVHRPDVLALHAALRDLALHHRDLSG